MVVRTILINFVFVAFYIKEVLTGANPGISTTFIGLRNEDNLGHSGYIYLSSESKIEEFQLTTCQNIDINLTTCNFDSNSVKDKSSYLGLLIRAWAATTVRDNILAFLNYLMHQSSDVYNEYTDDSLLFIYQEIKKNNIKMMDLLPGLTSVAKFEKSSQFTALFKVLEQAMPPFCKSPLDELGRFFSKLKYADREHLFAAMKSKGQEMDLYTDIGFQVIPSLRLKSSTHNYDKTILASLGREFAILFSRIQEGKIMLTQPVLAVLMLNMRFVELTPDENEDFRFIIDILRSNKISNWSPGFTASANIKCPYELVQRLMKAMADLMKIDPVVKEIAKRMQKCLKKPIRSTIIQEMDAFFSVEQLNIPLIFNILNKILESNAEVNEFQNFVENGTISLSYALKGFNRYFYDSPEKLVMAFVRRVQIRTPMNLQLLQIVSTVLSELKHRIIAEQISYASYDIYDTVVKVGNNNNNNADDNHSDNSNNNNSNKNMVKNRSDDTTVSYDDFSSTSNNNDSTINQDPLTVRNKRNTNTEEAEPGKIVSTAENLKENGRGSDEDLQPRRDNFGNKDVNGKELNSESLARNVGNEDDDSEKIGSTSFNRNFGNEDDNIKELGIVSSTRNFGNKNPDSKEHEPESFTRNFGSKEPEKLKIEDDSLIIAKIGNEDAEELKNSNDFGNESNENFKTVKADSTTIPDVKNYNISGSRLLNQISNLRVAFDCPKMPTEHNLSAWTAELNSSVTNVDVIKLVRDVSVILADFMKDPEIHYLVKIILDKFGDDDHDENKKYDQEENDGIIVLNRLLTGLGNKTKNVSDVNSDDKNSYSRKLIFKMGHNRKNNLQAITADALIVDFNATKADLLKYLLKNMVDIKKVRARRLIYYEVIRIYHILLEQGFMGSKNRDLKIPSLDDYPLDEKPTNASLEKFLNDLIPWNLKNYIIELNSKHQLYSIKTKHYKSNRLLLMKLCKILLLQEGIKNNEHFFDQIMSILQQIYDFPMKFAALIKFDKSLKPNSNDVEAKRLFDFLLEPGLLQLLGSNFDFGVYKTKGQLLKAILETVIKMPRVAQNHLLVVFIKNYIPRITCREIEAEPALEILEDVLSDQVDVNQVIEQGLKDELLPHVQDAFRGMWIWYGGTFDPIAFMKHLNVSLYDTCADFIEGFLDNLESNVDNDFMKVKSDIRDMRMAISKTGKGKEPVDYI